MEFTFPVREITEGAARLLVPDVARGKGPAKAGPWPFYNPTMGVNRDVSAIVLSRWPHPLRTVLDGLAATGGWGIRMALEAGATGLRFNDRSAAACNLARENVRRNGIHAHVNTGDLASHLLTAHYDFVDIDPFGPPTPFLDAAFESAAPPCGLGITATDTAVLCGTYPDACERRYGARPLRCHQGPEIGLRILLGHCARAAARHDKTVVPVLAFAAEHFLRVFIVVESEEDGAPLRHLIRRNAGEFVATAEPSRATIGPLWTGALSDPALVGRLAPSSWTRPSTARLLSVIQGEAGFPPFFVTTDELAARHRGSPPKLESFLDALRSVGYLAARTHFHPRGVKTDAPYADVVRAFRERMPSGSTDGSRPAT